MARLWAFNFVGVLYQTVGRPPKRNKTKRNEMKKEVKQLLLLNNIKFLN